ncbi:MAG: TrgA family protein [Rhodobacteraceae bacterium]|nr:TrgA family protein [Paracoccaceae bacterium]
MPTAAKLVASIMLAISGFIVVLVVVNVYPDAARRSVGLTSAAVFMGLFVGWRGLGKRIREDEGSGMISGLKAGIAMFVWVIFLYALEDMIGGIKDNAYYQPMTALLVIPSSMIKYGQMALNAPIIGTMVVLAAITGKMTKTADTRWS